MYIIFIYIYLKYMFEYNNIYAYIFFYGVIFSDENNLKVNNNCAD